MSNLILIVLVHLLLISSSTPSVTAVTYTNSSLQCTESKNNLFEFCIREILEDARPFFSKGIPEVNLPILEPLTIDSISIDLSDASLSSHLSTVQMRGISKFVIENVTVDGDTLSMALRCPELRLVGKYKVSGQIFALPIEGAGTFWMIMANGTVVSHQKLKLRENSNKEMRLYVVEQEVDLKFNKIRMRLNNLFNGNRILGDSVNAFLNENHREIFDSYKKDILKPVADVSKSLSNAVLSSVVPPKYFSNK